MATTMQEYLEEVARRQATGWTPGVPTMPRVSTTWNLPSTARTTMRQVVPKANLGDISAQSNVKSTTKRRGRPRTTAEMLQSISDRAGTGTIKPMLGAISKIAGPAGIAAELLRSEPAVASELAPGINPTDFRNTQAYPSMNVDEGYPNISTLPSFDIAPDAGGAVGGYPAVDYGQMAQDWGDPTMMSTPAAPTGVWDLSDPTGGLAATDPNLQGVTPMSMASTGLSPQTGAYERTASNIGTGIMDAFGIDTQQHMDNVGMINKLSQSDMLDVPTGWTNEMYAAGLKAQDFVQAGANPLLAMAGSYPYQAATEAFRATVDPTISYEEAMNMAAAQGLGGLIGAAGGLPAFEGPIGELIDDTVEKNVLGITTPDATPNTFSPLASSDITVQSTIDDTTAALAASDPALQGTTDQSLAYGGMPWGQAIGSMLRAPVNSPQNIAQGTAYGLGTTGLTALALSLANDEDAMPAVDDFSSMPAVVPAVDDFTEIPTTTVTPRVSRAAQDKEKARMRDLAKQQAADKHKANVAAAQAKHEENLRVAELTRQAFARQQQAAAQQAQIAREVQDAQDRVRQATALMNSKAYNESGMGGLTAAERDIVAAAQVDTFAGIGAEGPMSEAEINVAGGMEFGGAGGMAGSDRGGGGRGGPGGRGR